MQIKFQELLYKLKNMPFLSGLDGRFFFDHTDSIYLRTFKKNEVICKQGEYEDVCRIVLSGSAGAWVKGENGPGKKVDTVEYGEMFGEVGALSGNPRTATIISNEFSEILMIDKKGLFALMDYSPVIREFIKERYRQKVLKAGLERIKIFDGLPDQFFEELREYAELELYKMDETIVSYGEESTGFYFILYGFAKVLIPTPASPSNSDHKADINFKIAAYLPPGQYFGEIGLIEKRKRRATVIAITRLEVAKVDQKKIHSILSRYCDVNNLLAKVISNRKRKNIKHAEDESYWELMDWVVSSNIIQTNTVLLIDLNKCIKCETCIETCEKLFGTSRLFFNGLRFKNLLVPASCRHCHDPQCLVGCPTNAISRDFSGEVYHKSFCVGCGNCARQCPFGNIVIVDRKEKRHRPLLRFAEKLFFNANTKVYSRGASVEITDRRKNSGTPSRNMENRLTPSLKIATKCDNCKDYPHMACVQNCPRGAAQKVNPCEYFQELMTV